MTIDDGNVRARAVALLEQRRGWRELRAEVEEFLHWEAEVLDSWALTTWLELFTGDADASSRRTST